MSQYHIQTYRRSQSMRHRKSGNIQFRRSHGLKSNFNGLTIYLLMRSYYGNVISHISQVTLIAYRPPTHLPLKTKSYRLQSATALEYLLTHGPLRRIASYII